LISEVTAKAGESKRPEAAVTDLLQRSIDQGCSLLESVATRVGTYNKAALGSPSKHLDSTREQLLVRDVSMASDLLPKLLSATDQLPEAKGGERDRGREAVRSEAGKIKDHLETTRTEGYYSGSPPSPTASGSTPSARDVGLGFENQFEDLTKSLKVTVRR
jgi:hypothetical protein